MRLVWVLVAAAGCRQVFGIDPPTHAADARIDGVVLPIDAAIDAPPDVFVGFVARYNLGGPTFTGTDYPGVWTGDPTAAICGSKPVGAITTPINGTVDDVLFQSNVHGATIPCVVPVPVGMYRVTLLLADNYYNCVGEPTGSPSYNVVLEGTTVGTVSTTVEGDGCAAGGTGHPFTHSYDVAITDGTVDLTLQETVLEAGLCALEVVQLSD